MVDKKQGFILILVMMVFGVGIAYSLWVFGQKNIQANRDQIMADLHHIAAHAYQYRLRPVGMGGGGGSYEGYRIPDKLSRNQIASYRVDTTHVSRSLRLRAVSEFALGEIDVEIDSAGKIGKISETGEFREE